MNICTVTNGGTVHSMGGLSAATGRYCVIRAGAAG